MKLRSGRCNKAFTLSEVLLVLSVIGVVAALTMPTLVQKISDDQYKTAWKKSFSEISQAVNMIALDNGGSLQGICAANDDDYCFRNIMNKKLNFIKTCDVSQLVTSGCLNADNPTYGSGTGGVLNSGTSIVMNHEYNICDSTRDNSSKHCAHLVVDINGLKPPNIFGKDKFGLFIFANSVQPWGADGKTLLWSTTDVSAATCTTTGYGCGAKTLYE